MKNVQGIFTSTSFFFLLFTNYCLTFNLTSYFACVRINSNSVQAAKNLKTSTFKLGNPASANLKKYEFANFLTHSVD